MNLPPSNRQIKQLIVFLVWVFTSELTAQPTVSFTFDDGITADQAGYSFRGWNEKLLGHLDDANVKAIFFVTGNNKTDEQGEFLLNSWNKRGHGIANHTYSHPNYNYENISFEKFSLQLDGTDSIISQYSNYTRLFRFPYLKEGNTPEKVDEFRRFLEANNYENGYVTIDASDWYINSRLLKRLKENPDAELDGFRAFYLEHIYERATFYENLSYQLTGRHISHTLLLHHNLIAALFLGDLIEMFRTKGWEVISADKAYQDPIFQQQPVYAGESLIWALAKDSGKFEDVLRYPAEDSRYEKEKMDELGL